MDHHFPELVPNNTAELDARILETKAREPSLTGNGPLFFFFRKPGGGARKIAEHVPVWSFPYIPAGGVNQTQDAYRCRRPPEKSSEVRTTGGRDLGGTGLEGSPGGIGFSRRRANQFASWVLPESGVTNYTTGSK